MENGIPICTAPNDQGSPQIIYDGIGGAIITWHDDRGGSGNYSIYAQRADATGNILWNSNGVRICSDPSYSLYPEIVSDGRGGAIIAWYDQRHGNKDIYCQRIDAAGTVQWTAGGVAICTSAEDQKYMQIISDGAGGILAVWSNYRSGNFEDIYAQRIDSTGAARWTTDGVIVCAAPGEQVLPQLVPDGSGGAVIVWSDSRNNDSDIYSQRIDSNGNVLWQADGIAVCALYGDRKFPQVVADARGGAIVAWCGGNQGIYAQRVSARGNLLWNPDGVLICNATGFWQEPQLCPDGSAGAIVTWVSGYAELHIYAQRIDSLGDGVWGSIGVTVTSPPFDQAGQKIAADGVGGALIVWSDMRPQYYGSPEYDIYAQRVNASGSKIWAPGGVPVCTVPGLQYVQEIVCDGQAGAYIAWYDERDGLADIYASRIAASGGFPIHTYLSSFSAHFASLEIVVEWSLSEAKKDINFIILRSATSDGAYTELSSPSIAVSGQSYEYRDASIRPGTSYRYRVEVLDGNDRLVLFETDPVTIPASSLSLFQNYPNPFNPSTQISYYIPEGCQVALGVYDCTGKLIRRLVEEYQSEGFHAVSWSGHDENDRQVSSGVYFYRLRAGKEDISRKMALLK
jgi:hypothetical protein